jgi:hypothetical protein
MKEFNRMDRIGRIKASRKGDAAMMNKKQLVFHSSFISFSSSCLSCPSC